MLTVIIPAPTPQRVPKKGDILRVMSSWGNVYIVMASAETNSGVVLHNVRVTVSGSVEPGSTVIWTTVQAFYDNAILNLGTEA